MAEVTYIKIFVDYLDAIEPLGDAERGRLFTSLLTYARTGEAPQLGGNERFLFPMMRAQIDRDIATMAGVSEARSKAAKASKSSKCEQKQQLHANAANASKSSKDKDEDKDEDKKGNSARKARFAPPTYDEVLSYAEERGVPSLAKPFFEYFDTGKWVDAKGQPVRNWKQKFLTWESKEREKGVPSQPGKKPGYNVQHHGDELSDVQRAAIQRMLGEGA